MAVGTFRAQTISLHKTQTLQHECVAMIICDRYNKTSRKECHKLPVFIIIIMSEPAVTAPAPSAAASAPSVSAQTFTINGTFNGDNIVNNNVNNNVNVVKIRGMNVTRDGRVYLPDQLPLLKKNANEDLLKQWLYVLPHISTKSEKYPEECIPQVSNESINDLKAVLNTLHDLAAKVGRNVAEQHIIKAFKSELYRGRPPKSIDEIKLVLQSSDRHPVDLAKWVANTLSFNDHFYRTTLKDELNKEGAKGCRVTKPWTFQLSGPNGTTGKDSKPTILQAATRGFSRTKHRLSSIKYGGEFCLSFRKPDKKKGQKDKFYVTLSDEKGNHSYLVIDKKGKPQLEALERTPTLDKLPGLLHGDERKLSAMESLHDMGSSFVEAAKDEGMSLDDIIRIVRKAFNPNGSIEPEPSEGDFDDRKLSEIDVSPMSRINVSEKLSFDQDETNQVHVPSLPEDALHLMQSQMFQQMQSQIYQLQSQNFQQMQSQNFQQNSQHMPPPGFSTGQVMQFQNLQQTQAQNLHPNGPVQQGTGSNTGAPSAQSQQMQSQNFQQNSQHMPPPGFSTGQVMQSHSSQQMQAQNFNPNNGPVQQGTGGYTGAPSAQSRLETEFGQNAKKVNEEAVDESPSKDADEESDYDEDKYGVPSKIIDRTTHKGEVYYTCYWEPSKSGTEYPLPSSAKKTDLEQIEGIQDMIDQFEKEWKQKAAAKTVPSYFIIPYFQSISTLIPFVHVTYYSHKAEKASKKKNAAKVSTMCHVRFIPTNRQVILTSLCVSNMKSTESEKIQQKGTAKTVPHFIIPYFQSIFTSFLFVHVTYYSHKAKKRTKEDAEVSTMRGSSLQSSSNLISLRFARYHHIQKGIPTALFEHNLIIFIVNTFH